MASQLTVPGFVAKWIVIPAMLAAAGYIFIGPRLGKGDVQPTVQSGPDASAPQPPTSTSLSAPATTSPEHVVAKPRVHRRKKHRTPSASQPQNSVSVSSENFPQAPPPDQGETGSESETSH